MVSVFLSFVPFPILKRTGRYVQTFDANNISKDGDLGKSPKTATKLCSSPSCQNTHLPDSHTNPCILIWHVINANTLAQHVRFVELPSGFDSGPRRVVVFFYNWTVVMEKSS